MKFESVSSDLLLPMEYKLPGLEDFLRNFDPALVRNIYPIPVIPYGLEREEQRYILGDGHHRSAAFYLRGEDVPLKILETNYDIINCEEGAFYYHPSKKLFLHKYEHIWKPILENAGIRSIPDLVQYLYPPEQLKDFKKIAKNAMR